MLSETSKNILFYLQEEERGEGISLEKISKDLGISKKTIGSICWLNLAKDRVGNGKLVEYNKSNRKIYLTEAGRRYTLK